MDVTDVIGRFGAWQRRIFYVFLYRAIPCSFVVFNVLLFSTNRMDSETINFCCVRWHGNVSFEYNRRTYCYGWDRCEKYYRDETDEANPGRYVKCESWNFTRNDDGRNINEEWSLVCHRSWLIILSYVMLPVGTFISYIPGGHLSDKYGRRRLCLIGMTVLVVVGVAGVFTPNVECFVVLRLITGIAYGIFQTAAVCLFVEAVGPEYRILMSVAFMGTWGIGIMLLSGMALLLMDWRMLQLTTYVLAVILPALVWKFVPESPRWLLSVGRDEEAEKIICEAAKMNGVEIVDGENSIRELRQKIGDEEIGEPSSKQKLPTFSDLHQIRTIKRMTAILYFAFSMTAFVYYGFTFGVTRIHRISIHLHMLFVGLAEVLGSGVFVIAAKYMSRRKFLLRSCFLSGFFFFMALAAPHYLWWLHFFFAIVGRTCNSMSYTLLWLLVAEIFPTNLRAAGVGRAMSVGSIGSILALSLYLMRDYSEWNLQIGIFGSLAFLTSALCLLLQNIKVKPLPDTIQESESLPEIVERRGVDRSEFVAFLHKVFVS